MTALLLNGSLNSDPCPEIVKVPRTVAVCPECGGILLAQVDEWETPSGIPTEFGVHVDCENEPDVDDPHFWDKCHRGFQSDWIPVTDRVSAWARRHVRVAIDQGVTA